MTSPYELPHLDLSRRLQAVPFTSAASDQVGASRILESCSSASRLARLEVHVLSSQARDPLAAAIDWRRQPDRSRLWAVAPRDRCASFRLRLLGLEADRMEVHWSTVAVRRAAVIHRTRAVEIEMVEGTDV